MCALWNRQAITAQYRLPGLRYAPLVRALERLARIVPAAPGEHCAARSPVMVRVMVDSGQFPLMRNVDVSHQPSRSRVYTAWIKAFSYNVPWALNAIADVIEDVFRYELWKDHYLATPQEFFNRFGLGCLNLEEPAKLIRALRELPDGSTPEEVNARAEQLRALEPVAAHGGKREQGDNITLPTDRERGTATTYTVRRLKRDNPELAERVISGELSANAAALLAGFRRPSLQIPADDAQRAAEAIRRRLGNDFALALMAALAERAPG